MILKDHSLVIRERRAYPVTLGNIINNACVVVEQPVITVKRAGILCERIQQAPQ
jgi:hypothetical protein